jgi:hypothetical protein
MHSKKLFLIVILILGISCDNEGNKPPFEDGKDTFFTSIPESHSNVSFENKVVENLYFNFLNYAYIYNGGGVSVGDINNDGLDDIYFISNQNSNALYLNKGNFVFEDITESAKVKDDQGWSTGVSMIDINNDGWLDIYVCKSGSLEDPSNRQNKLFINQKNNTFKEEATKYGLNQHGFSTQSYFFDYDKDGDLDMYLVNHRPDFNNNTSINPALQRQFTQEDSDHLFQNDNGSFINVTQQSKVVNKAWGLSAAIGDFNNDNWPDIYVANDFLEPDFLYINNKDGTFTDQTETYFKHISTNSMGSDYADINNDLFPDLLVLDMMAADRKRGKENMATMSTENFNLMVKSGYHHQYMSNMLQLNNGEGSFSEIGQLSGIAKTDWSWAPLIADFDNDGYNDVFVTNGIENDLSNQDFRNQMRQNIMNRKKVSLEEAIAMMPSTKLTNYLFINSTDHTFIDVSKNFGFDAEINSNGAAYADLDNDGDLDLVLNNQSDKASIYRNNANANYISVSFKGSKTNKNGIGAKVWVYAEGIQQLKEMYPSRGYQSSVNYMLNFGLGKLKSIDSLIVKWDDNRSQVLRNPKINSLIELSHNKAQISRALSKKRKPLFEIIDGAQLGVNFTHKAVEFNDYDLQLLLPQKQSTIDKAIAVGDVNNDGLDDFFVGNTNGHSAQLYLQNTSGQFVQSSEALFERERDFNDNGALLFDADNDNDLDLYVTSGNYDPTQNSRLLQDRLYINDGVGNFSKGSLPRISSVTKAVTADDFDSDGDMDLFVGGRVVPGMYPKPPESYLLENRNGIYVNITTEKAAELERVGLVNDAMFNDFDNDGDKDLIVVGEWMPVLFFENDDGFFRMKDLPSDGLLGWFQTVYPIDGDQDGDMDFLVGNFGENNKFHPSEENPLHIYANNFDENESFDIALSKESQGDLFPVRGKECSSQQTPFLNEKIKTFKEFASATIVDVYGADNIDNALHLEASTFSSYYVRNNGDGNFDFQELPNEAQFGPTLGFESFDVNNDGVDEIIGVGSIYDAEVETIRYDASRGYILDINMNETLSVLQGTQKLTDKEVKAVKRISINGEDHLLMLNTNEPISFLKLN